MRIHFHFHSDRSIISKLWNRKVEFFCFVSAQLFYIMGAFDWWKNKKVRIRDDAQMWVFFPGDHTYITYIHTDTHYTYTHFFDVEF